MRRAAAAVAVATMLVPAGCAADDDPRPAPSVVPSVAPSFAPGTEGIGDPYFPRYGNGGYDVGGYDLKLTYAPASGQLDGTATITATATQDLSAFNLDLSRLAVSKVTVDGQAATSRTSARYTHVPKDPWPSNGGTTATSAARTMTNGVYNRLKRSMNRAVGAFWPCASCTISPMREIVESSAERVDLTSSAPSPLRVPA